MATPPEPQLVWFAAALDDLADFLLSGDVFRPLSRPSRGKSLDLSLGALILAGDALRANAGQMSPSDRSQWSRLQVRWEAERERHAVAIERKAAAELPNRVNLWRAYLSDLGEKPEEARGYPTEVRHRVILDRLSEILPTPTAAPVITALDRLDKSLRRWFAPGPFAWPDPLRAAYPEARFWYLYGRPERDLILANPARS
jgi:hypothetical protein